MNVHSGTFCDQISQKLTEAICVFIRSKSINVRTKSIIVR